MFRWKTPLCHALSVTLTLAPALARADDASPLTSALQSATSGLQNLNTLASTVQASNANMNSLYQQMTNLQAQTTAATTPTSAIDQLKQDLATALTAAQTCMTQAEAKKTSQTARYKKATVTNMQSFLNAEPTCSSYGNLVDSGRRFADLLAAAKEKTACFKQLQNAMGQAAEKAKTGVTQMTQAAQEVWNTRTQIIDTHKNIAERINNDLNGETGYKSQLAKLKELSASLQSKIGAGVSRKDGKVEGAGLQAQAKLLKEGRTKAANAWKQQLIGATQQCFTSDTTMSCNSAVTTSPQQCVAMSLGTQAGAGNSTRTSPVAAAQRTKNMERLGTTLNLNAGAINNTALPANLDVKNSSQFLTFVTGQVDKMVETSVNNFRRQTFFGSVDKTALGNFIKQKYTECYQKQVATFQADMAGEGELYKSKLRDVEEQEAAMNNDVKTMLDAAQSQMNEFRTAFNKVYNNDLPQFANDCTANDDPYKSLDCLKMVAANLKSGIEGTQQTVALDSTLAGTGGKVQVINPPATVMTLQTLSLNAQGKPTIGSATTSCVGFNECINVLDRYRQSHIDQQQSAETERTQFVDTNNKTLQTLVGQMAAQFGAVSKLYGAEIEKLNTDMAAAGVTAALKTKQVEGEELAIDEKTKLYSNPKDIKKAIASQGPYTELDDPQDTVTELNEKYSEVMKKINEALKKKEACKVAKEDYDSIVKGLGECKAEDVCSDSVSGMISPLERVLRKSSDKGYDKENTDGTASAYNSCTEKVADKITAAGNASADKPQFQFTNPTTEQFNAYNERADQLREKAEKKALEGAERSVKACGKRALNSLAAITSRSAYKGTNENIINAFQKLANACPILPDDEEAANKAVKACKDAKSAASGASIADDGETPIDSTAGNTGATFSNPLNQSAK